MRGRPPFETSLAPVADGRLHRTAERPGSPMVRTAVSRAIGDRWITLLVFVALFAAWQLTTASGAVPEVVLPTPEATWAGFWDLVNNSYHGWTLAGHARLSLERVSLGFLTGSIAGTLLGLAMGYDRRIREFFGPLIEFFRQLPQLAYLVLLVVWFGIGDEAQITLLFLTALPVASVAAMDGVASTSVLRLQAARSLGANGWQVFRYVIFPSTLLEIFTGARLAIGVVYATVIAAEMIGGSAGLGWMILDAGELLRSDYVVVGIILLGILGLMLDRLIVAIERRVVHWAGRT